MTTPVRMTLSVASNETGTFHAIQGLLVSRVHNGHGEGTVNSESFEWIEGNGVVAKFVLVVGSGLEWIGGGGVGSIVVMVVHAKVIVFVLVKSGYRRSLRDWFIVHLAVCNVQQPLRLLVMIDYHRIAIQWKPFHPILFTTGQYWIALLRL